MGKHRAFLHKYRIPLALASFVFIGLPQYIDSLWSLYEKISEVEAMGLNITWLYLITVPVGLGMLGYIIWQSTRVSAEESKLVWAHYNKLTDLILSLENTPHEKWSEIVADMQRELNTIGDKTINKYMSLYFRVIDETEYVGIHPPRFINQRIFDLTREHMIKKYKRF